MSVTKNSIFQFKQFAVDQTGCAMKVNTDGVLLGVLTSAVNPQRILDIGTGTGVIALILAQRFPCAKITALDIDASAAATADLNFASSPFSPRLQGVHASFEEYFQNHHPDKFNLIVSNPPFFIDSLRSDNATKGLARHTDQLFYETLLQDSARHLEAGGQIALIVPIRISEFVQKLSNSFGLHLQTSISIKSFPESEPHRKILILSFSAEEVEQTDFIIYAGQGTYSAEYQNLLKDYFTIFS